MRNTGDGGESETRRPKTETDSPAFLQTNAHEVFDRRLGAENSLGLTDRIVGLDLFESKRHQGQHGVVDFLLVG